MLQTPFQTAPLLRDDPPGGRPPSFTWAGEFRDQRLERNFLDARREEIRQLLFICGIAATAAFFLLIIRDYLVLGLGQAFYWTAMIRCVGLATGLIFQAVVMRAPSTKMLHVAITAGMANLTTLVFLTWITAPRQACPVRP